MPPKKTKKKKTKAEKEAERLAKEEEARKQIEEEKKRQDKERMRRQTEERLALEERIRLRNEEVIRFEQNSKDQATIENKRLSWLDRERQVETEKEEWKRTISCNDAKWPSEYDIRTLNTYVSLEQDDSCTSVCNLCSAVCDIMKEIDTKMLGAKTAEKSDLVCVRRRLVSMLLDKIDKESALVLSQGSTTDCEKETNMNSGLKLDSSGGDIRIGLVAVGSGKMTLDAVGVQIKADHDSNSCIRLCRFPFDITNRPTEENLLIQYRFDVLQNSAAVTEEDPEPNLFDNSFTAEIIIPENIAITQEYLVIAKYDNSSNNWSSDKILAHTYDTSSRIIKFDVDAPGIIGVFQKRLADLPYKHWSLTPLASSDKDISGVEYILGTRRFDLTIHISGSRCTLVGPTTVPELKAVLDTPLSPEHLVSALRRIGIYITPQDSDAANIEPPVCLKMPDIEERAMSECSNLSTVFRVQSSAHSKTLARGSGCYLLSEIDPIGLGSASHKATPVMAPNFTTYVELDSKSKSCTNAPGATALPGHCGSVRCSLIEGAKDDGKELDLSMLEGTESCLYVSQCLMPLSEGTIEQVWATNPILSDTVRRLLQLTRPFVFL